MNVEKNIDISKLPDHIYNSILSAYIEEEVYCKPFIPYSASVSRADKITWATEVFFPKLLKDLGLSDKQIHYLQRIADYVNRGDQILSDDKISYSQIKIIDQYVELIVRSMEFKAAGIDEYESFNQLDQFHMQYHSPLIRGEISEAYQQKVALYQEIMHDYMVTISGYQQSDLDIF